MIENLRVDITIRDHTTGDYLVVPVLPETIPYTLGDKEADTINVLSVGEVDYLRGKKLDTFNLVSFFPARYDASYCVTSELKEPLDYRKIFNDWKNDGTILQVICPAAGINMPMTLRSFVPEYKGFEGDIYYTADFKQHKTVKPKKVPVTLSPAQTAVPMAAPSKKPTAVDRPKVPAKPKPKTYTTKPGDNATNIAKKLGLRDWKPLAKNNKGVLSDPAYVLPGQIVRIQ